MSAQAPPDDAPSTITTALMSLLNTASSTIQDGAPALATIVADRGDLSKNDASWPGLIGHGLLLMGKAIPGFLIWAITFTTITIPTLLFALFSTSLTFTMNFTTL